MSAGNRKQSGESAGSSVPDRKGTRHSEAGRERGQATTADDAPATTILQTKLRPPDVLPDLVARPRLVELLEQNPRRPLTLVSAAAGYGKTTLVTQWLRATEAKPAWLQLGEEDSDLRAFLTYFVAAVRVQFPKACPDTTTLLHATRMPSCSVLADALTNDLEAIDQPFTLVLDDYHCVADTSVHELLDNVLRYPPRPLHLVLISRHDPPISLASLRGRGWVTEIRQDDLRFSRPEVRAVLEQMAGISVSDSALTHLETGDGRLDRRFAPRGPAAAQPK